MSLCRKMSTVCPVVLGVTASLVADEGDDFLRFLEARDESIASYEIKLRQMSFDIALDDYDAFKKSVEQVAQHPAKDLSPSQQAEQLIRTWSTKDSWLDRHTKQCGERFKETLVSDSGGTDIRSYDGRLYYDYSQPNRQLDIYATIPDVHHTKLGDLGLAVGRLHTLGKVLSFEQNAEGVRCVISFSDDNSRIMAQQYNRSFGLCHSHPKYGNEFQTDDYYLSHEKIDGYPVPRLKISISPIVRRNTCSVWILVIENATFNHPLTDEDLSLGELPDRALVVDYRFKPENLRRYTEYRQAADNPDAVQSGRSRPEDMLEFLKKARREHEAFAIRDSQIGREAPRPHIQRGSRTRTELMCGRRKSSRSRTSGVSEKIHVTTRTTIQEVSQLGNDTFGEPDMYDVLTLRVLVVIVVTSCIVSRSCYSDNESAFTHEDILTVLRDQEGRINDFLLEFDCEEAEHTESGVLVGRKRQSIMLMAQGPLFRTRKKSFDPETQELLFDQEFAGDGSVEYFCDRSALYGTIRSRLPEQCVIRQSWASDYLLSVMRSPRKKGNFGFEGNLAGALEEAPKGIKISEGFVDGRKIVVLTRFSSPGIAHSEIRLDPQMNFAVLSKTGIGMHKDNFRFINSDFVEVIDGIWLPRKVERSKRDKTSHTRHETIRVKTLEFNKGYEKGDFSVRFPDGVRVRDVDAQMHVTPSARENETNSVPSALEDTNQAEAVLTNANEGNHGVTGRSHLSWKMVVPFLMLGLAGIVYILSQSVSRKKKTRQRTLEWSWYYSI